jgi:hypothetical protein
MPDTYKILFIGDVVGKPGRIVLAEGLPCLQDKHDPLFIIVNGENAAGGVGITPDIAEEFYKLGVDGITLGNHAFNKRDIFPYLDSGKPIIRPANMPSAVPGRGLMTVERENVKLAVMNLCGRVFLDTYDDPFREVEQLLETIQTPHILLDMHAEATSEKLAMGWFLNGRATAVVGTHTHVATADEQVMPGGTAYITDVGMTGPYPSVLGVDKDIIIGKFKTSLSARFEVANEPGVISGVLITARRDSGRATSIERIRFA